MCVAGVGGGGGVRGGGFETQIWQTYCVDEQLLLVHLIFIVCIV